MTTEAEVPSTKRVELSNDRWVELRTTKLVGDVRHQRQQRHERGDFDDEVLDELSLIEVRVLAWSFGAVSADIGVRRIVIDALSEDDAMKLVLANRGVEEGPKDSPKRSRGSSTGTRQSRATKKQTASSPSGGESGPGNG